VIFGVDHLVLCGSRQDLERLRSRLSPAGFVPVPGKLRFDDIGAHSESLAYRGGGFVELAYEMRPGAAPAAWFDGPVPRVMGIGVSSDDFEHDTEGWLWTMDDEQRIDDGSTLRIHAAGPNEHLSPLYLFAMDRPDRTLDHPHLGGVAELVSLRFRGQEAELWRRRIYEWFGGSEAIGDVELRFEEADEASAVVTPSFRVPAAAGDVALAAGSIELV